MFEMLLMAQAVTADYVCWAEFGYGTIDLTGLCDSSISPDFLLSGNLQNIEPPSNDEPSLTVGFFTLPTVNQCAELLADAIVEDPEIVYIAGMYESLQLQCADDFTQVLSYNSPSGALEIIEPIKGQYWTRIPNNIGGYGPFYNRSEALEWMRENHSRFFRPY